ncbi:uncharacterized protein F4812DRAFT_420129 [Daldinia caldariorum]|uniref:uncharacterized protein n=1 Tax=Daldinia caldariorum TaxID=326644 RepID=UPI0020080991|nr:uncharacterized protein F4812DRAFT_420129 [Daldinia caldariorum]KAI1469727.1 hypothetical protein F4812DRAFT_420129 [Daldinia caldariorum]
MRSFALAALPRACGASKNVLTKATPSIQALATRRTFSSLPTLRPTLQAWSSRPVFRNPNTSPLLQSFTPQPSAAAAGAVTPDLVPKTALTSHPSLSGAAQVRFGPRPTMARTSRLVRKRRHGFLSRLRTHNGRKTLQRRKEKKRSSLSQ